MRERVAGLFLGVETREHHAGRAGVEHPPGPDAFRALDAHDHRHVVRGGGQQLTDERVLAAGAVLEVEQQPVEAGQRAGLRRQGRAEVEERAEGDLAGAETAAQRGAHPNHRCVARPAS